MLRLIARFLPLLAILLLIACAREPLSATTTPVPDVAVVTEEATATPSATTTPVPTATLESPTATVTPVPTEAPLPTATLVYCAGDTPLTGAKGDPIRVFFVEDGNLRLWDEETDTTETLVEVGVYRLYISPDGETVAFLRQEEPGMIDASKQMALWAVDADGGNERLLIDGDTLRAMGPARIGEFDVLAVNPIYVAWLPGTEELAFRVYSVIHALGNTTEPEIRLVDTGSGAQRVLLTEGVGRFTFSPDERRMTLVDDDGIDLLDVGGGNRIEDVVTYPTIGFEGGVWYPTPIWTDDGSEFSISIPSANLFDGKETLTVWEVTADDGAAQKLGTFDGFPMPFFGNMGSAAMK